MIRPHSDYLVFELDSGESILCSVEAIAFELVEAVAGLADRNIIENAARAVVHYFREELRRETVSIHEFIDSLSFVLKEFGYEVEIRNIESQYSEEQGEYLGEVEIMKERSQSNSLVEILEKQRKTGALMELGFFKKIREIVAHELQGNPDILLFTELRPCVQSMLASSKWTRRCELFSRQIISYIEACLCQDGNVRNMRMVIR